jgi:hypothetical protein
MFIMPDFIHTLDEWIIWLLGAEFHQPATPAMLMQRTHYAQPEIMAALALLEREKAIRVNRNTRDATKVDSGGLTVPGKKRYEELKARSLQR